jgi:hypothetical protein
MDMSVHGEAPLRRLGDLAAKTDAVQTQIIAFLSRNLGHTTLLTHMSVVDFCRISVVANDEKAPELAAQRKLDPAHAKKLATFLLKGLVAAVMAKKEKAEEPAPEAWIAAQKKLGEQPYQAFQPLVANIRVCKRDGVDLGALPLTANSGEDCAVRVFLQQSQLLWVIDGQHRRRAMEKTLEFLSHAMESAEYARNSIYDAQGAIDEDERHLWAECMAMAHSESKVAIEIHLGLGVEEERQLFHDLNQLGKKVEAGLALRYDKSSPLNVFTQEMIEAFGAREAQPGKATLRRAEKDRDAANWEKDDGSLAIKDIVGVNRVLFVDRGELNLATRDGVSEEKKQLAVRFWDAVLEIEGFGQKDAKKKTTAAQPVMLKGMAKVLFDLAFGGKETAARRAELVEEFFEKLPDIDFGHGNDVWAYFTFKEAERKRRNIKGLSRWLNPRKAGANQDIGWRSVETGCMRFNLRHNDIYPVLSDMIRWQMGLPKRKHPVGTPRQTVSTLKKHQ